MFTRRKTTKLFSILATALLILVVTVAPITAATPIKIGIYMVLEDTHLFTDEVAQFASYLLDRATMYYQLAMVTGDLSFLEEIKPLFDSTLSHLASISGIYNCSSSVQAAIEDITSYLSSCTSIVNQILSSTKPTTVYDSSQIKALVARVDSLNDIVVNTINPKLTPSKIDTMSIGAMSLALRAEQQILMNAISIYAIPSQKAITELNSRISLSKNLLETFRTQAEKSISKATDLYQRTDRQTILNSTIDFFNQTDALVKDISGFNFPSTPALNPANSFMRNIEFANMLIANEILGAVFS